MSAQCQHKLVRYECWKCRDEWKEPKPMSIDVTSNNDALAAEVAALRHDIERHVQIPAEQAQEIEELRHDLAAAREHVKDYKENSALFLKQRDELQADLASARACLMELRIRLHAVGRRPEECYEISMIDAALAGQRREGEK